MNLKLPLLPFSLRLVLAFGSAFAAPSDSGQPGSRPFPPELATLNAQFLKLEAERVSVPFEKAIVTLNSRHSDQIKNKIQESKLSGNLDAILALENELRALVANAPVPQPEEGGTAVHPVVTTIRAQYHEEYAKIKGERTANFRALTEPLDRRLALLETEFTKNNRLNDAKIVRAYRDDLANGKINSSKGSTPADVTISGSGFTNSLGMKFVKVPETNVLFCIHETRYGDYKAYAESVQGVDEAWKDQTADNFAPKDDLEAHPVMRVSWEDAQKFCSWLSAKEGKTYRLPTFKEWSHAVGLGRGERWEDTTTPATLKRNLTDFPWGTRWPPPKDAGNYSDNSRYATAPNGNAEYIMDFSDGFPTTAPVMRFKPNKLGIFDLGGNVWEWVDDWYDEGKKLKVCRGGSWHNGERGHILSSGIGTLLPTARDNKYGYRIVLVSPTR